MKQCSTGQYLYSPSDLIAFLECPHTSQLSIKSLSEEVERSKPSTFAKIMICKGHKHETDYLQKLKDDNRTVIEIPTTGACRSVPSILPKRCERVRI